MRSLIVVLLAWVALSRGLQAHPLLQNAMWVQFEPTRVRVALNVSAWEIAVAQGLASRDDPFNGAALAAAAARHRSYVEQHLMMAADGHTLTGTVVEVTDPPAGADPEKAIYQYQLDYPFTGPPPAHVIITENMLREWPYAIGTPWDVNYTVRSKRSDSTEISVALLRENQPTDFPTGWGGAPGVPPQEVTSGGWPTFGEYFQHGVMHILTGWDHLLFVSALVIATMNFWEMVKVIAAFTLAHTITLTLAVFDVFRLPPWIVEPVIAVSIIFVALENVIWPRRTHSWSRLGVAFGFGLIHGLGFAGGLLDAMVGLPRIGTWIALGAFSLGVEIGHQLVVLPLFGTLALGRQRLHDSFTGPAMRSGSIFISLCGAYYFCIAVRAQFFGH